MQQQSMNFTQDDYQAYLEFCAIERAASDMKSREDQGYYDPAPKAAGPINFAGINALFDRATESGLKKPAIHANSMRLSLAPATGNNPGFIYIKVNREYQGKLSPTGRWMPSRDAEHAQFVRQELVSMSEDPEHYISHHGKESGECCLCGRELTDPESVARGIGPICAERWGF